MRAEGSAPVVGSAGLIHLHESIVLVSRVVGGQNIHLIPPLRLFPGIGVGAKRGEGNLPVTFPFTTLPRSFSYSKTFLLYPLVVSEAQEPEDGEARVPYLMIINILA